MRYVFNFFLIMLAVLLASPAQSSCGTSQRVPVGDAGCLDGIYENHSWPKKDWARVQNTCSNLGKVVAKIDRAHTSDWTVELTDDSVVTKSGAGHAIVYIRSISCCSDLSDLCNKSDVINEQSCTAKFEQSPAVQTVWSQRGGNRSCDLTQAEIDGENCKVTAHCYWPKRSPSGVWGTVQEVPEWNKTVTGTCHINEVQNMDLDELYHVLRCEPVTHSVL